MTEVPELDNDRRARAIRSFVRREGRILVITLNRPDKRNALSVGLRTELLAAGVSVTIAYPGVVATEIRRRGFNAAGQPAGTSGLKEDQAMPVATCARLMLAGLEPAGGAGEHQLRSLDRSGGLDAAAAQRTQGPGAL